MKTFKNPDVMTISGDKEYSLTITFNANEDLKDFDVMKNAAMAIKHYADNRTWHIWAKEIKIN